MTSQYEEAKYDERGFVVTAQEDVAASGGTLNLSIQNPEGSNTEAFMQNVVVTTQFKGSMVMYDSFSSAPTNGTSVTVQNLLMDTASGTPDSGEMDANKNVTFTDDGTHLEQVIPSGGQGASQIGGAATGTDPILQPGREMVVEVTNTSASQAPGSINVIYREGTAP